MRRGNLNGHVRAFRYVTVGTFDSYLYQTVQNKQAFISQVFMSDDPARSAADLDETVLSYAEIKALATGDPNIQRRMELENRAGQLKLLKSAHSKHMDSLRMNRGPSSSRDATACTSDTGPCARTLRAPKPLPSRCWGTGGAA